MTAIDAAGLGLRLRAVILGLVLGTVPAQAQRLPITTFTLENGLPSAVILDLAQDFSGRLWIAHQAGLSVYDGRTFQHHSEKTGLSPGEPGAVTVDSLGRVWTVTRWRGPRVGVWDGSEWRLLPDVDEAMAAKAPNTQERSSLAVVPGAGSDGGDLVAVGSAGQGLLVWDGSAWKDVRGGSRPSDMIRSLAVAGSRIAVGTGAGLCFLAESRLDCSPAGRLREPILGLSTVEAEGGGARLWIYAKGYLGYLDLARAGNGVKLAESPLVIVLDGAAVPEDEPEHRGFLTPDAGGGVFFGNRWLYFLDAGRHGLRRLASSDGLASEGVTALLTDREGNVWVGSPRGLSRIAPARFLSFGKDSGFLEEEVSAIFEQAPNQLILGHNTGLSFFDTRGVTSTKLWQRRESGPANLYRTMDFARDPEGTLWVAAYRLGVLSFSRETGLLTGESPYRVFLPGEDILAVEIDSRGRLWAAGFGKIYLYENATFREIPLRRKLQQTRWLIAGASGRVYAATRDGLFWREDGWSEDHWQEATSDVPEAASVFSVLEDPSSDRVLVGTLAGLRELRTEPSPRITSVTEPGLVIDHPVYFILSGSDGVVWFGTDDGVRRWDGSSLRRLSVEHGMAGYETNRGAAAFDHLGRFWIGTSRGLSVYQGGYDHPLQPPISEIVSLEVNGEPLPLAEPIRLGYRQKNLTFRYTAVSLVDAGDVLVRYRLEGFAEEEETVAASSSGIRYTNLPPGTYRFHLAAGREEGTWSDEVVSVPITISRPLWQMPWAWVLAAVTAATTVLGGFHLRTQALRARTAELEGYLRERDKALAERDRVIAELHEKNLELGRFTYTVSHDLKSPLVTIRGFLGFVKTAFQSGRTDRVREDIERIERASERMARLLDELLELSRLGRVRNPPEKVALPDLAREAAELAAAAIAAAGAEVRIADDLGVVTGDRTRLREVFQNLIENAAKFMGQQPNPLIEVGRRPGAADGGEGVVFVRDNGRGIDPRYQERVFGLFERLDHDAEGTGVGLALVQRIVELHGGRIWVESDGPGHGSTFCFTLAATQPL